ncbi:hypothetical protein [Pseudomonas sp. LP_7_YM]|uniref:hypothetical protein n=1 Tax=Pseudomonas sp. LP_7_YM TaxID=2485137 RepID=UPI00105F0241|nr:hypothetical protein [Pseudomonas sp. LP_7_YM]TDV67730.1 hypothetical protein EC915_103267 [Pseudomonas sp. LP_7_YM]
MRTLFALSLVLLLAACSGTTVDTPAPPTAPARIQIAKHAAPTSGVAGQLNQRGEQALALLQSWYNDRTVDCGGINKPAYLCSGVWIRLTTTNRAYLPWDPSPGAITKGGISFAWLRQDQTFSNILVDARNGLLFYPNDRAPAGKYALDVLCTFPRDANTWERDTLQGCGPSRSNPETTVPCQPLGILTARQWIAKYGEYAPPCGWDLRPKAGSPGRWFDASAVSHQTSSEQVWQTNNELIVSTWQPGIGATLPMVAFVYLSGSNTELEARTKAWIDQIRYYDAYGVALPILRIELPKNHSQPVTFRYSSADQGLDPGNQRLHADFEDVPAGTYRRVISNGLEFLLTDPSGEVRDDPLPSASIKGHYAVANSTLSFGVKGQGPLRVTFDWGCNEYCFVGESMTGKYHELYDGATPGQMRFGTYSVVVEAPEHITLGSLGEDATKIVLDNVRIEPVEGATQR